MKFPLVKKYVNTCLNHSKILKEIFLLKLIFQIMKQKQTSKIFDMLILQVFHEKEI